MRARATGWGLLLALSLAAGCDAEQTSAGVQGLDYDLREEGPYKVGYQTWDSSYVHAGAPDGRSVPVHVWYPTEDSHDLRGDPPTEYPIYIGLFTDGETIIGATPAPPVYEAGYPVIAYSHGARGVAEGSYRLMRYFASHGWLAVSVGHVGDRLIDPERAGRQPLSHWFDRPLDVTAGLDAVEALGADHPLAGLADTSRVLLTGHSRGAYTVWSVAGSRYDMNTLRQRCAEGLYGGGCSEEHLAVFEDGFYDPRVVAILPTAGTGHSEFFDGVDGRSNLTLPVFFMTASLDDVGAQASFDSIEHDDFTWVEIEGGCHELFNIGCGRSEDLAKFHIVTTYALAFGRSTVLDDPSELTKSILRGDTDVAEEANLVSK